MPTLTAPSVETRKTSSRQICQETQNRYPRDDAQFRPATATDGKDRNDDKGAAMQAGAENTAEATVYSDGSMIDGGVGAAAVLYRGGVVRRVARKYMGTADEHTVFEAELLGAALGAKMLREEGRGAHTLSLDNQVALQTTREERAISGQYLVNALHEQVEEMRWERGETATVTMRWVPGHKGVRGNERADSEAKKAAKGDSTKERHELRILWGKMPKSRSAELQRHHKALKAQAKEAFASIRKTQQRAGKKAKLATSAAEDGPRTAGKTPLQDRKSRLPNVRNLPQRRRNRAPFPDPVSNIQQAKEEAGEEAEAGGKVSQHTTEQTEGIGAAVPAHEHVPEQRVAVRLHAKEPRELGRALAALRVGESEEVGSVKIGSGCGGAKEKVEEKAEGGARSGRGRRRGGARLGPVEVVVQLCEARLVVLHARTPRISVSTAHTRKRTAHLIHDIRERVQRVSVEHVHLRQPRRHLILVLVLVPLLILILGPRPRPTGFLSLPPFLPPLPTPPTKLAAAATAQSSANSDWLESPVGGTAPGGACASWTGAVPGRCTDSYSPGGTLGAISHGDAHARRAPVPRDVAASGHDAPLSSNRYTHMLSTLSSFLPAALAERLDKLTDDAPSQQGLNDGPNVSEDSNEKHKKKALFERGRSISACFYSTISRIRLDLHRLPPAPRKAEPPAQSPALGRPRPPVARPPGHDLLVNSHVWHSTVLCISNARPRHCPPTPPRRRPPPQTPTTPSAASPPPAPSPPPFTRPPGARPAPSMREL
ncbi:hypothetical protein JB92DRAFT_3150104 [Gautieria morchelliformis]|nr:hypothetical protein JB92DRAFT_3150104 [Gautieria morchelliformis]